MTQKNTTILARNRMLSRRDFLLTGSAATVAGALGLHTASALSLAKPGQRKVHAAIIDFAHPKLPYAVDALQPHIDARTMEIHHGRHHAGYANNLRNTLEPHAQWKAKGLVALLEDIPALPEDIQTSVRNNGGGHYNHNLFWEIMSPAGGGNPVGALGAAIVAKWGTVDAFRSEFARACATRFGSGWGWLSVLEDGSLAISSTPNQDNPLMKGLVDTIGQPVLGLDVWEHAYYLHYQNRRGDYIDAWWHVVNWEAADALYRKYTA